MSQQFKISLLICLSSFFQLPESFSQSNITDEVLKGMKYRSVGPSRGGRATAATGVNDEPFTFYTGTTGGGIWKTEDAGTSWNNISDGQIKAGSIGSITVAPSDKNVLYVGTGSAAPRGNISAGIGIYKSTDKGKNWTFAGLPKAGQIGKIEVHPNNPDLVYVAALGNIFGPNPERGIYRSKDGGANWEQVLFVSDSTGAVDIVMNPKNPRELYAAMWRAERKPWTLIDGGTEGGIFKSTDGGNNWKKLKGGLPTGLIGKIGLAIAPTNPDRVYACIIAKEEKDGGIWRSDNAGKSWKRVCRDHKLRQRGWYYAHISADPQNENTVYVSNVGFYKSIDGGKTFDKRFYTPHGDHHGVWINPNNTKIMISVNDGGACISLNGGETWSSQFNQPTSEFYRLTVDNGFPYRLYAGQQDNSTISVPSKNPGGISPTQNWYSVGGSECGDVGVHPTDPDIVWAGSYSGELTYTNRKTGETRQVTAYPHYTEGTEQRDLKYRWQWNFPIIVSVHDPNTVYHASNYVHRTTDNGQSWKIISPDLTQDIDAYQDIPGGPIQHDATGVEVYSSIFALEESSFNQGELWAGSDDGLIHISRDGGENWENITPKGMPKEGTVNKIELSAHAPGRAFVAVYNYRNNDFKPYLFRTDNFGKSWESLTDDQNGIPDNHFIRAIAEDPKQKGLLYVGTEYGMYISLDDGQNWRPFQQNLPHTPITDMEVHQNDLVISTQGRAFWILDDLTPLHKLSNNLSSKENHLFKPRNTYRSNVRGYSADIHFYIHDEADLKSAKLEILDASGETIRTYTRDSKNALNKFKIKKGYNTFKWNLRHEGPELEKDLVTMVIGNPAPGPRVVPGTYVASLSIGTWSFNHSFEVLPDPRWKDKTTDDYQAQLDLALKIRDVITKSHDQLRNIRAARKQINTTSKLAIKAGHADSLKTKAKELAEKLTDLEAQIKNKAEASQDNINYRRVWSNHIGRLYQVVTGAHDRPTAGALERWEDLQKEYEGIEKNYGMIVKEIDAFETLLEQNGVEQIILPEKF